MTQRPTRTGKFRGAPKQAQIRLKDFANSFNCASDPKLVSAMDSAMEACMAEAYARQYREGYTELWTDGSYDDKDHRAGIGIMIRQMPAPGSGRAGQEPDIKAIFGKAVKASDSQEAELYAMAVGLSYLLDACPDVKSVRLRYDCVGASVTAANIDAYASRGAPYTNFRSALKRARKAGVVILFQHVKSHAGNDGNEICDLLAKHYANIPLLPVQHDKIAKYTKRGTSRAIPKKGGAAHGGTR